MLTNLASDDDDDALADGDEVLAAPLVDDLLVSGEDGLDADGGVALGVEDEGVVDDCAMAPESAKALSATPNMSLFNILASKK